MALEQNGMLGHGGSGMQGNALGSAASMLKELQGLSIDLLAGQTTPTKHALAAIRPEDTIVKALNNAAGTITDITVNVSILDTRATGTITLATAVAGNTVTVNGLTYTGVVGTPADYTQFSVDTSNTAAAASLAAAINEREKNGGYAVMAVAALAVVTLTAVADGTAGNAITLAKVGTPVTISGATLANGTATGGITSSSTTNQVILFWMNKR